MAQAPLRSYRPGGGPADHGKRKIGNWWSDNAFDLMAKAFDPVFAPENLVVTSVTRRASTGSGVNDGSTVFATGSSGEHFAFLHLAPTKLPRAGERIPAGAEFAVLGDKTAGGPHLHFATRDQDPVAYLRNDVGTGTPNPAQGKGGPRGNAATDSGTHLPFDINPFDNLWGWITEYGVRGLQVLGGFTLLLVGLVLLGRRAGVAAVGGPR